MNKKASRSVLDQAIESCQANRAPERPLKPVISDEDVNLELGSNQPKHKANKGIAIGCKTSLLYIGESG